MKFTEKFRLRRLEKLIAEHPDGKNPMFLELTAEVATALPKADASAVHLVTCYCWNIAAQIQEAQERKGRAAAAAERARFSEIVKHGNEIGDIQAAIKIALETDLSATDAARALSARDSGAPLKPSCG
jgi:predicted nucleic acid-binding protein